MQRETRGQNEAMTHPNRDSESPPRRKDEGVRFEWKASSHCGRCHGKTKRIPQTDYTGGAHTTTGRAKASRSTRAGPQLGRNPLHTHTLADVGQQFRAFCVAALPAEITLESVFRVSCLRHPPRAEGARVSRLVVHTHMVRSCESTCSPATQLLTLGRARATPFRNAFAGAEFGRIREKSGRFPAKLDRLWPNAELVERASIRPNSAQIGSIPSQVGIGRIRSEIGRNRAPTTGLNLAEFGPEVAHRPRS